MSTFALFSNLPKELRLKIWEHALDNIPPRLISIYPMVFRDPNDGLDDSPDIDEHGNLKLAIASCWNSLHQFVPRQTRRSSLLYACAEARIIALQRYQRGLTLLPTKKCLRCGWKTCDHLFAVARHRRDFYFDPRRDALHFRRHRDVLEKACQGLEDMYVYSPADTSSIWMANRHVVRAPRFVAVTFDFLSLWLQPIGQSYRPNRCEHSFQPDLSATEVLMVLMPREKEAKWRVYLHMLLEHPLREAWCAEDEQDVLEEVLLEDLKKVWQKEFWSRKEGFAVRMFRSDEEILEAVARLTCDD